MKYTRPEVEIMEFELVDVIQTSEDPGTGEEGGQTGPSVKPGSGTPIIPVG